MSAQARLTVDVCFEFKAVMYSCLSVRFHLLQLFLQSLLLALGGCASVGWLCMSEKIERANGYEKDTRVWTHPQVLNRQRTCPLIESLNFVPALFDQ